MRRTDALRERELEGRHARPQREVPRAQHLDHGLLLLQPQDGAGERDHEAERRDARERSIPASSESTSASQEASMTFSWTPIAPHVDSPSEASSNTRVVAPVAFHSSRMRTLKFTSLMSRSSG